MITAHTKLCCIIGKPVHHSLSPQLHNAGYKHLGLSYVFVAFEVSDVKVAINGLKALGVAGIVVTVPHKQAVMRYVDSVDRVAQYIGAVNTVVNTQGKLTATNTDWSGSVEALEEKTTLEGKKVAVLGAGGAARAVIYGLKKRRANVTIFNRTLSRAKQLANDLGSIQVCSFTDIERVGMMDIIVNTTTVGMVPNVDFSPVPPFVLRKHHVVFDIVYTPKETKLLQDAKKVGATLVYGERMLLYAVMKQFELFTGQKAPLHVLELELKKFSI